MTEVSLKVFCSYSHKDESLRDELDNHLSPFTQSGIISTWHDRKILPGEIWDDEIKKNLKTADIILLLISADFLSSRYCWEVEINTAIKRHQAGEACVIPIILRSVYWKYPPLTLAQIQALPKNATPVISNSWHNRDEAFTNVVEGIWNAAEKLIETRKQKVRQQEETENLQTLKGQEEAEKLQQKHQSTNNDLLSDKDVDYRRLRDLLADGKWKQADEETAYIMLMVAERQQEGWLDLEDIKNFPYTDLHTIDSLWVKYSQGRFGFSVQKRIFEKVNQDYTDFGKYVRWHNNLHWIFYFNIIYSLDAPLGHLPCRYCYILSRVGMYNYTEVIPPSRELGQVGKFAKDDPGVVSLLARQDL